MNDITKCDIIRAFVSERKKKNCVAPECSIPRAANDKMYLFADLYSPTSLFIDRTQEEIIYEYGINAPRNALSKKYPSADVSIDWSDFERCLWNEDGRPGGPFNNIYFGRGDLMMFGMVPDYPLGGKLASGLIWRAPNYSPLPVFVDYIMNPDLAALVLLFILITVVSLLFWRAKRDSTLNTTLKKVR